MAESLTAGRRDSLGREGGVAALAARLGALTGWRRLSVAGFCGLLAVGALPPLHLVFLLIPAFVGLIWMLEGVRSLRGAFALGWAFGTCFFLAGLYWVGIAFLVDAPTFGWMMPFAVAGLAAGLALFIGAVTALTWKLGWRGAAGIVAFASLWVLAEWLRGWLLTGFPWNLLGTAWAFSPVPLQPAAWFGVWGLSLLTVLAAAAPAALASQGRWHRLFPLGVYGLLALVMAGGALRLAAAPAPGEAVVEDVRLRLVQPSIEQELKWDEALRLEHIQRQIELSAQPAEQPVTHLLWAETAVPFFLERREDLRAALGDTLREVAGPEALLLTGAPSVDQDQSGGSYDIYNSLFALQADGGLAARYDKFHLVPFGEYVPLAEWLPIQNLAAGGSFTPGPGPRTLHLDGLPPVSPLICYEVIFPGRVLDRADRPDWIFNVTNDAWFGISSGPYQHFASARLRAVEQGLPLVRVANSGISAVIDPQGRVLARLELQERGVLDSDLPRPVENQGLFARFGTTVPALLLLGCFALGYLVRGR